MGSVNVPTYHWNLTMDIQGVVSLPTYVGFTSGLDLWGVGLLGQAGFFDRIPVHFDNNNGVFQIFIP